MPLPAAIPLALTAAGLLGGSAVGQVLDRPRRFVMQDLPEMLGGEGYASGRAAAQDLLGEDGQEVSPLALALGFGIDTVADPLTYLGGGAGRAAGSRLGRIAGGVDDLAAQRAAGAMPLARDAVAGRKAAGLAETALGADLSSAQGARTRQLGDLQLKLENTTGVVGDVAGSPEVPVPGGAGLLARYAGVGQPPVPVPEMLSAELRAAVTGTQGRKYKPREYTPGASAGDLPMTLDAMGAGGMAPGGKLSLPVPPSETGGMVASRGGRVFPGEAMQRDPLSMLDLEAAPNPEYAQLQQALWGLQDSPVGPSGLSTVQALGLSPQTAVPLRFHTRGATAPGQMHPLDQPVADAIGPLREYAGRTEDALAQALAGPPPGAGPLGRLYFKLFGTQPRPNPGEMVPGNPVFDLYKPR